MLNTVPQKLEGANLSFLRLGITETGEKQTAVSVPWDLTVTAMNMKLPSVYLSVREILDPEVLAYLSENVQVISCYIFTPMDRYDFLAFFPHIVDLYILRGANVTSLSFMRNMKSWNMLYLQDARLADLADAFPPEKEKTFRLCLALLSCEVENIDALLAYPRPLSELVIFRGKDSVDERKRWKQVKASHYRYYTLERP